jgi:hypothetical protein
MRKHTHQHAACINQDHPNPAEQLNGTLGSIIGSCDMMVTPMHDPTWREWSSESVSNSFYYPTSASTGTHDGDSCSCSLAKASSENSRNVSNPFSEYLGRGWCRLEMFFNSNIPLSVQRAKLFGGELRRVMTEEKRRPHLVFGTREKELGEMPVILRAVARDEFEKYHPGTGYLFDERDRAVINAYVGELYKINTMLKVFPRCVFVIVFCACASSNLVLLCTLVAELKNLQLIYERHTYNKHTFTKNPKKTRFTDVV